MGYVLQGLFKEINEMPLVRNSKLPTFDRLEKDGRQVLDAERAAHQDIREMHIGLLNIMPDAALEATERQFLRLIGESDRIVQIHIHPFTLPMIERGTAAKIHIDRYYENFEDIKKQGLDALIVTGTNPVSYPDINERDFWQPLIDALEWAHANVASTLCSCLTSHVAMIHTYGQKPTWHDDKRWGVYTHRVMDCAHPLVRGMNTKFDVIHSRHRNVTREQFEAAGLKVLVENKDVGVHLATSADGFRVLFLQGHPEYDMLSLLKEYKREVLNFVDGKRKDYPEPPVEYFSEAAYAIAELHKKAVLNGEVTHDFPEEEIARTLDNTWTDSARSLVAAWIGLVYQVTNMDRQKQFMDGVDPNDPLGLKNK
jgi:homoserine O-succinyltransferase/O-acetyltransferase